MKNDNDMAQRLNDILEGKYDNIQRRVKELQFADSPERLQMLRQSMEAIWNRYKIGCRSGDILSIPSRQSPLIKNICDFSKSIVSIGGAVYCVMH